MGRCKGGNIYWEENQLGNMEEEKAKGKGKVKGKRKSVNRGKGKN